MNTRTILAAMAVIVATLSPRDADAQCSTGDCPPCTMCRVPPATGSNPSVPAMSSLFDQIAAGPNVYGSLGWDFGTAAARSIASGPGWCGTSGARDTVPTHFPCVLLKAIYTTESNWTQFCSSNLTVIAFDCGYGIAQVTSGMRPGDTSLFDPNQVASSPAYNVSVGASILADKWRATPCVGNNNVDVIEDWYFAVWAYNGLSFSNNPNNPMYSPTRPEFRTPGIPSAQVRSNYPYQEIVWGYVHYPPSPQHWTGIGLAYPNRSEICATCGDPTANISEPMGSHLSTCPNGSMPDAGVTDAAVDVMDVASATDAHDATSHVDAQGVDVGDVGDVGAEGGHVNGGCGCSAPARGSSRSLATVALGSVLVVLLRKRRRR